MWRSILKSAAAIRLDGMVAEVARIERVVEGQAVGAVVVRE